MKKNLAIFSLIFLVCAPLTSGWGADSYKLCVQYFEDKDFAKAYQVCKETDDSNAQFMIGEMYYNGLGVKENHANALIWYRKAAEQGNCESQFRTGHMYYYGDGVKEDHAEALKWFQKAAKNGHPRGRQYRDEILNKEKNRQPVQ